MTVTLLASVKFRQVVIIFGNTLLTEGITQVTRVEMRGQTAKLEVKAGRMKLLAKEEPLYILE